MSPMHAALKADVIFTQFALVHTECHADKANKAETAVHGCHCPGDMGVRMR